MVVVLFQVTMFKLCSLIFNLNLRHESTVLKPNGTHNSNNAKAVIIHDNMGTENRCLAKRSRILCNSFKISPWKAWCISKVIFYA